MALSAFSRVACAAKRTCGLSAWMRSAAVSALRRPMSGVPWMIWRCRLDSDTVSSSTTPSSPNPAAPGGGEIHQRRRAEPARADHQHGRLLQRLLAGSADLAQDDVAGVAFEF